jgi:hypothetical protein
MPSGSDPYGAGAMDQRIWREHKAEIKFAAADRHARHATGRERIIVTNPVTHQDTVYYHETGGGAPSSRASSRNSAATTHTARVDGGGELRAKLGRLEATLAEERAERLHVQDELTELKQLLEASLAKK